MMKGNERLERGGVVIDQDGRIQGAPKTSELAHRFVVLRDYSGLDGEGAGTLRGMPVLYGSLNSHAECFLPGSGKNTIDFFLKRGFIPDSHDWYSVGNLVGLPTECFETDEGMDCTMQFHSTECAQKVRTVCRERRDAGKEIGLSIGFRILKSFYVYPKDYEKELPKYFRKDRLQELMQYARTFPAIRIVQEYQLFEYSIVTAPSEMNATVTDMRNREMSQERTEQTDPAQGTAAITDGENRTEPADDRGIRALALTPELRSQYLGAYAEEWIAVDVVIALMNRLIWYCLYDVLWDPDKPVAEKLATVSAAFDEMRDIAMKVIETLIANKSPEELREMAEKLREQAVDPELEDFVSLHTGNTLERQIDLAQGAVEKVLTRATKLKELRVQQGKKEVFVSRTSEALTKLDQRLVGLRGQLEELLKPVSPATSPELRSLVLQNMRDRARQQGVDINV